MKTFYWTKYAANAAKAWGAATTEAVVNSSVAVAPYIHWQTAAPLQD